MNSDRGFLFEQDFRMPLNLNSTPPTQMLCISSIPLNNVFQILPVAVFKDNKVMFE